MTTADSGRPEKKQQKKLVLQRETLHSLNDPILSSQGHSLWTCGDTAHDLPEETIREVDTPPKAQ